MSESIIIGKIGRAILIHQIIGEIVFRYTIGLFFKRDL